MYFYCRFLSKFPPYLMECLLGGGYCLMRGFLFTTVFYHKIYHYNYLKRFGVTNRFIISLTIKKQPLLVRCVE